MLNKSEAERILGTTEFFRNSAHVRFEDYARKNASIFRYDHGHFGQAPSASLHHSFNVALNDDPISSVLPLHTNNEASFVVASWADL